MHGNRVLVCNYKSYIVVLGNGLTDIPLDPNRLTDLACQGLDQT
jgi:hypothetical protein